MNTELLLSKCLKPEVISGDLVNRIERVQELISWFERYAVGSGNPKWLAGHAFELAYYLAITNSELKIDFDVERKAAFKEGLNVPEGSTLKLLLKGD